MDDLKKQRKFAYTPNIPKESDVIVKIGNTEIRNFNKKSSIKCIVWNTFKAKKKGFYKDFEDLCITQDLILLQESLLDKKALDQINSLKVKDTVAAISFYTKNEIGTGVCTISNVQHKTQDFIRSSVREPLLNTHKMALITQYPIGILRKLTVINVHGINFVGSKKFAKHMEQISMEMTGHHGPIIIAGDFNTWSVKRSLILKKISENHGLTEISFANDRRKRKLDRVFVRGLNILKSEILNDIISSDHKPLFFEFIIK